MKLNKIALAVLAAAAPLAVHAGVTVSPLLLGYHYTGQAQDEQRKVLLTGRHLNPVRADEVKDQTTLSQPQNGGVAFTSDLYTGAAVGIELTPSTQLQVEYGASNAKVRASETSWDADSRNRFDGEQTIISGNLLVGTEQFTGHTDGKFKPYVLVGAGQSRIKVENLDNYIADADNGQDIKKGDVVPAGTIVAQSKDIIANVGLGARYLVNDALALRGEARAVHNFDKKWWEGLAMGGLEVTLGGRLAPAVPVPPAADEPVYEEPVYQPAPVDEVPPVMVEQPIEREELVLDEDMDGVLDHLDACPGTPRNLVVDARGCPVSVVVEDTLTRDLRVFFDYDKSVVKPQFRDSIAQVAQFMNDVPNATAVIEGHASKDSKRSSAKYNQRLSEARANAVKSVLSNEFGIAPNRLTAVGYGFDRPVAPNDTAEGRALNRRVFAVIEGVQTKRVNQTK